MTLSPTTTTPAPHETEPAAMSLATNLGPSNTDTATVEGVQAAGRLLAEEFPEISRMEIELVVNAAASDWRAGREAAVMARFTRDYGLMMAYRLTAAMLATPGTPRGA